MLSFLLPYAALTHSQSTPTLTNTFHHSTQSHISFPLFFFHVLSPLSIFPSPILSPQLFSSSYSSSPNPRPPPTPPPGPQITRIFPGLMRGGPQLLSIAINHVVSYAYTFPVLLIFISLIIWQIGPSDAPDTEKLRAETTPTSPCNKVQFGGALQPSSRCWDAPLCQCSNLPPIPAQFTTLTENYDISRPVNCSHLL